MIVEIKVPSVGESITEAVLAQWYKNDGDVVKKDEPLFVIETDKVTLEVVAEADGVLSISVAEGETVAIGAVVGTLDTKAAAKTAEPSEVPKISEAEKPEVELVEQEAPEEPQPAIEAEPSTVAEKPGLAVPEPMPVSEPTVKPSELIKQFAPSVRRLVAEKNVDVSQIVGTGPGGRITKGDVLLYVESGQTQASVGAPTPVAAPEEMQKATAMQPAAKMQAEELITRKPMTPIRRRIAERLLESKQNTAMLTTFNEIDMSRVMDIRKQYKQGFKEKYGVNLGIMSFFIKASIEALKEFPQINAFIDGKDIIEHHYYHIGVAVGSERGLVVPVIRHADKLSFAELELAIVDYLKKINKNRLVLADLEGGTFTISNGGVYGSLLSTPILNMPQSGILGMHKIEKRPVVIEDEIVIHPMMYVALSYDHRIVDGREAVTFLKRIKECVENPERIMMEI
ncbi:MAG: 2-oxoglutarate dehydrogenase complex dihydrolipoyllysine-residue succinyltransferase [Desulfobacterales bacterium]|nr:MAG: 2-oxoglutarate dehydrogenase complex dihydrolipoyllysine-residue succinyltransferase [Desulfobacterales bacterium]